MTRIHDFVVDLAKAGKLSKDILDIVTKAYGAKAISRSQVFKIVAKVKAGEDPQDQRGNNAKKTKRTTDLITSVEAAIKFDRRHTIKGLSEDLDVSTGTIYNVLHLDLGLSKRAARWVPRELSNEHKLKRVH